MVNRLKGRLQAFVLVIFFLPYVLPVSVVTEIWNWMLDFQYGVAAARARLLHRQAGAGLPQPATG